MSEFCPNCGIDVATGISVCPRCGTAVPNNEGINVDLNESALDSDNIKLDNIDPVTIPGEIESSLPPVDLTKDINAELEKDVYVYEINHSENTNINPNMMPNQIGVNNPNMMPNQMGMNNPNMMPNQMGINNPNMMPNQMGMNNPNMMPNQMGMNNPNMMPNQMGINNPNMMPNQMGMNNPNMMPNQMGINNPNMMPNQIGMNNPNMMSNQMGMMNNQVAYSNAFSKPVTNVNNSNQGVSLVAVFGMIISAICLFASSFVGFFDIVYEIICLPFAVAGLIMSIITLTKKRGLGYGISGVVCSSIAIFNCLNFIILEDLLSW